MFTIAYIVNPKPGETQLIAFLLNGNPRRRIRLSALPGAVGPVIMDDTPTGAVPNPCRFTSPTINRPGSILQRTPGSCRSPVGTGFSRGEGKDDIIRAKNSGTSAKTSSLAQTGCPAVADQNTTAGAVRSIWSGGVYGGVSLASRRWRRASNGRRASTPRGIVMISPALDWAYAQLKVPRSDRRRGRFAELCVHAVAAFFGGTPQNSIRRQFLTVRAVGLKPESASPR